MNLLTRRVRGFRLVDLIALGLLTALILGVYLAKTIAGRERTEIAKVERQIDMEKSRIRLLQAEVSHLEQPARIERLSEAYLGLAPAPVAVFSHYVDRVQRYLRGEEVPFEPELDGGGRLAPVSSLDLGEAPLMLTEFALLTLLGGAIGVGFAKLAYTVIPMGQITQGFLVGFTIFPATIAIALIASLFVGLIAGGLPAINATRMSVVDGLRRVV